MAPSGPEQVRQWVGKQELLAMDIIADGVSYKYTNDKSEAGKLFVVAEGELIKGKVELEKALEALRLFRASSNTDAVVDALRLVIHCYRAKAESLAWEGDLGGKAAEVLRQARILAAEQLEVAQESKNTIGEAGMLLSLAELGFHEPGKSSHDEAESRATKSAEIFSSSKMTRMQAVALLVLSRLQCARMEASTFLPACETAKKAMQIASSAKDADVEMLARHHLVNAQISCMDVTDAVESLQKLKSWTQSRLLASDYARIALAHLKMGSAGSALPLAREAHLLLSEMRYGRGWEAAALGARVDAMIATGAVKDALTVATDSVNEIKARGDEKESARAMRHLVHAHVANQSNSDAMGVAQEAVSIACQDLAENHSAVVAFITSAQIYLKARKFRQASEAASQAEQAMEHLGISHETSSIMMFLRELQSEISRSKLAEKKIVGSERKAFDSTTDEEADEPIGEERGYGFDDGVKGHAQSYLEAFKDHMAKNNPNEAAKAASIAVDLFAEQEDGEGEAKALLAMAAVQIAVQQYDQALLYAESSLDISKDIEDPAGQADALHLMACAQNYMQKPDEAIYHAQQALYLYRDEVDDVKNTVKMYFVMVDCYDGIVTNLGDNPRQKAKKSSECEKALGYAKKAAKIANLIDDKTDAYAQYYLSHAYMMAGRYKDAAQTAQEAKAGFKGAGDDSGEVRAQTLMAQAYISLKKNAKAKDVLDKAMKQAKDASLDEEKDVVSELLEKLGSATKAAAVAATAQVAAADAPVAAASGAPTAVAAFVGPDPEVVKSRIIAMVGDMTGSSDEVEADTPFMDSGIDSLASVELRTNLQQQFGVPLPSTVMFNFPTTNAITDFLVEEMTDKGIALK